MIDGIIMFVMLGLSSMSVYAKNYGTAVLCGGVFLVYLIDRGAGS